MDDITATVDKEVSTLKTPPNKDVAIVPTVGEVAPVTLEFKLPRSKPTVIVFFRYCGDPCMSCLSSLLLSPPLSSLSSFLLSPPSPLHLLSSPPSPFSPLHLLSSPRLLPLFFPPSSRSQSVAEKNFRQLAALSAQQPGLDYIAVSLCSRDVTDSWVSQIGGSWNTDVIIDTDRNLYARWGLGLNTSWQLFNPRALYTTFTLGRDEGIWGRPVDDGNRWQMGGAFAVDTAGFVKWVHVPNVSDDVVDFNPMLQQFGLPPLKKRRQKKHDSQ